MSNQQTLHGDTVEPFATIETTGRVIRPWKQMIQQFVDEARIHIDEDGLYVSAVDSANVAAIQTQLYADAFESYTQSDAEIGVDLERFGTAVQHARYGKQSDDEITLQFSPTQISTEVNREVEGLDVTYSESVEAIDPASVREDFELPKIQDRFEASVELPSSALISFIDTLTSGSGTPHIRISGGETVTFGTESDVRKAEINVEKETEDATALFSGTYMDWVATALKQSLCETATLEWGEDYPIVCSFERDGVYSGKIMVSPRVRNE